MRQLNDPQLVVDEYASEERLRRRASFFTGRSGGRDNRAEAVRAVVEAAPRRVLEVGCGWGELAEWIGRATGAEVVATDLSLRMVELARERGLDARLADVQALPFADGEFDVAVAAWMLYHVPDLDRGLAELARVLRPGGRLVAVTNSAMHLGELRELVGSGPSPSPFTSENGGEILARHFATVDARELRGSVEFATRGDVEAYVRASVSRASFVDRLPDKVAEPFVASTHITVFVVETAP